MKGNGTVWKIFTDAALLTCAMLAAVCSLPSAFELPFSVPHLLFACVIAALLLSGWLHLPRGGVAFGGVFLILTALFCATGRSLIADGARYSWYRVLLPLSGDFSFLPVPASIETLENPEAAVTAFLTIAAVIFGMLTAFVLIRGKLLGLTVLMPVPTFLAGLIYTNLTPKLWIAALMLIYVGGVMVGHSLRKHKISQRGVQTALVLPLLVLLAVLLRVVSPPQSYEPISFSQRQAILGRTVGKLRDSILSASRSNPKNVDLSGESDRTVEEETAFLLYVTTPGEYLLRTHSYGQYDHGYWVAAKEYKGSWSSMSALGRGQVGAYSQVKIRDAYSGERIVPYGFVEDPEVECGESYTHAQGRTAYSWTVLNASQIERRIAEEEERAYYAFAVEQYTMRSGPEKRALLKILNNAGIQAGQDPYQTAKNVAAYVRSIGTYTLKPRKTPDGTDFVQFFLMNSRQGYCVHFASATTALLQALDIPARYTVGYCVYAPLADVWMDVPLSDSHAWAEVYLLGVGWVPVESTPGFGEAPLLPVPGSNGVVSIATPTPTPTPTPIPTPTPAPSEAAQAGTPFPDDPLYELPLDGRRTTTPKPTAQTGMPLSEVPVVGEDTGKHVNPLWLLLLLIPALPLVWLGIGAVIRKRRKHIFLQKDAKKAIVEMARYHHRLELLGLPYDTEIDTWAEEAMFSNHPMTEERRLVYRRIRTAQMTMHRYDPMRRFWLRWVRHLI